MQAFKTITELFLFASLFSPVFSFAHGDEKHNADQNQAVNIKAQQLSPVEERYDLYSNINRQYLDQVKPIFEKKCFDCHANTTKFPWYYSIPGIKQMIDDDIKEAKKTP